MIESRRREGGKRVAEVTGMLRWALPFALILHQSTAFADAGDVSAAVRVVGDSRGTAGAGASGALVGINCDLATVDGSIGHLQDGATWSAGERAEFCPWDVGLLDVRITQEWGVGILPGLSDRYLVTGGTPYAHSGWGVELGLFDLLNLFTARIADPATLHRPGIEPKISVARALAPQRNRLIPIPFWVRYSRTTQAGRTLEQEDWGTAVMRWRHDGARLDLAYFNVGAATWGDGVGVSPLTFYPARLENLTLGPVTLDLAAGWATSGGTQSNPQFATMTPPALEHLTIVGGHALVRVQTDDVEASIGADRTMTPYLADGLAIDSRAQAGLTWTPRRGPLDRVGARAWAARTELIAADGSTTHAATWGSAIDLGLPLPHRARVDITAELGRSFYARLGLPVATPALGGTVTATVSAAFGK